MHYALCVQTFVYNPCSSLYLRSIVMIRDMPSKIDSSATLNDGEEVLREAPWKKPCRADRATILSELKSLQARICVAIALCEPFLQGSLHAC